MPPYRPALTEYQRWNLAGACLANAKDLLRESRVLLDAEALTRSAFVLLAAFEEALKARYVLREPSGNWKEWWAGFRSHEAKLWGEAKRLAPEVPEAMARTLVDLREKSLFVDIGPTGDPLTPRGLLDPGGLDRDALLRWGALVQAPIKQARRRSRASRCLRWRRCRSGRGDASRPRRRDPGRGRAPATGRRSR